MKKFIILAAAAGMALSAGAAHAEKWDMPMAYAATNYHSEMGVVFADKVRDYTGGKIDSADIAAERFGAAPHTDFGVLTILQQDSLGGLQVLSRDGCWIEAMPIADTFVCNIGDLLERWTNGKLVSTRHRVLNRSGKSRFSIPIFCDPASEAVIDPRDFDPQADIDATPPIAAGAYIMGKNRRNFSHFEQGTS